MAHPFWGILSVLSMKKSRHIIHWFFQRAAIVAVYVAVLPSSYAQTLPVGTTGYDDWYRRKQLLGELDSTLSFSIRPLTATALQQGDLYPNEWESRSVILGNREDRSFIEVLPISWQHQVNTAYPYGWNDGAMIPARGYQTLFSAGFYAQYKWFSLRVQPEFVFAQNSRYEGYGGDAGPDQIWYNEIGNRIDYPELFGNGSYTKLLPGQSSFRITYDPVSVGISTENLWWGPGRRNSLLMSNTAPGFLHATLNTSRPIRTYIGSFEGQLVAGRLESSGYPSSLLGDVDTHQAFAATKPNSWRYFSGIVLSYQPRWTPGLTIGMIRSFTAYRSQMGRKLGDYLPIVLPGIKKSVAADGSADDNARTDQMASFFFRWVIPKVQAELYAEYGRNDHPWDFRDLFTQLDHSRAYTVGVRKLVPLQQYTDTYLQVEAEVTQLAGTNTQLLRPTPTWYVHHQVRHGYTNLGQVLGAGIGPGSNSQSVGLSWIRGLHEVGLRGERLVHNEPFANEFFQDRRRNWVDLGAMAYGTWTFQRLVASAALQYTHAYNYQYRFQQTTGADYWDFEDYDKNNVYLRLGLLYRF